MKYGNKENTVIITSDGSAIPVDNGNSDYRKLVEDGIPIVAYVTPIISYNDLRRAEMPSTGDQLDALWKGGAEADAMKAIVQAIKDKYPKT